MFRLHYNEYPLSDETQTINYIKFLLHFETFVHAKNLHEKIYIILIVRDITLNVRCKSPGGANSHNKKCYVI